MSTLLIDPPIITTEEVYARFNEHFSKLEHGELLANVRTCLPNTKKRHYEENAKTTIDSRALIVSDAVSLVYRYFKQHQPDGYVSKYGRAARVPVFPTTNEYQALELLTDYLLADDLAAGLTLRDRFREEADVNSLEYPPLGGAARWYMDNELNGITPAMMANRKVCESCKSYFIDTSPAKNAKRCGPRCTRWAEMLRISRHRHNGAAKRKRDRERQQHEYPFYSPYELEHINSFSERCYKWESIERTITTDINGQRSSSNKNKGRKKPQGISMDSEYVSTHFKPYKPSEEGDSGAVTVRYRRPEVISRYLRMKYGDKVNTPYKQTYR